MWFCLHFIVFIVRFYSSANSGQLFLCWPTFGCLCLVGSHLVGSSLTTHLAYLTLKTIILDHAHVVYYLNNIVIYKKMINLESRRAYYSLHVLHLVFTHITLIVWVCVSHVSWAYGYLLIDGIDLI